MDRMKEIGDQVIAAVKGYVNGALVAVNKRYDEIAALVAQIPAGPRGEKGDPADPELVRAEVAKALAALPPPPAEIKAPDADAIDARALAEAFIQGAEDAVA